MCGICGSVGFPDGMDLVHRMNRAMVHRGPDSEGTHCAGAFSIGMRRLRIIDLEGGDQPLFSERRDLAVVLNGEIYNFRKLRSELAAKGHEFASSTDTEVVVHGFEEWGAGCFARLRGMFAVAVLDMRRQAGGDGAEPVLWLARDRCGIKPLYVWSQGDSLLFASEVRALLATGAVSRRLSPAGLYSYLQFGSVQEPNTLVGAVRSLRPGWLMSVRLKGGRLQVREEAFCNLFCGSQTGLDSGDPAAVRSFLQETVAGHLVADVPLGSFLSGGIDSGALVALASGAKSDALRTFTLAFDGWPGDERVLAEATARHTGADHRTIVVSQDDVLGAVPEALRQMDQPSVDALNTWYVSRAARRAGLTVALSGVGGDELFAGYPSFRIVPRLARWYGLGRPISASALEGTLAWLWPKADAGRKLAMTLGAADGLGHPYFSFRSLFSPVRTRSLLGEEFFRQASEDEALQSWRAVVEGDIEFSRRFDEVGAVSYLEIRHYMRSTLLRDTDCMSMAHSLEVRVPFVDHELVEAILPLPGAAKLQPGCQKPLLVRALGPSLLPAVTQTRKRTFTMPVSVWLREGLASPVSKALSLDGPLAELGMRSDQLGRVWQEFCGGRTNWARPWALYVLGSWLKENLQ